MLVSTCRYGYKLKKQSRDPGHLGTTPPWRCPGVSAISPVRNGFTMLVETGKTLRFTPVVLSVFCAFGHHKHYRLQSLYIRIRFQPVEIKTKLRPTLLRKHTIQRAKHDKMYTEKKQTGELPGARTHVPTFQVPPELHDELSKSSSYFETDW